jgi:site-specific recombinase XerD
MEKVGFEEEIQKYLNLKDKNTAGSYASGFRSFLIFYKAKYGEDKGFSDFLDRIFNEFKKDLRNQESIAEVEVSEFIGTLKQKGLSANTIRLYIAALQNFLKYKHIVLSTSFINVPAPNEKKENGKHEWTIEQIKEFVNATPSYRDKAIILCMFQSGLAVQEICNLNFGDVQSELQAGILPICLKLVRQKTDVKFKTFFGRDAVHYLKLYLATRKDLKGNSPLFIKERDRGDARLNPTIIQQTFSEIAVGLKFIEQNGGYNSARPHSLRAAFNTRLVNKMDEKIREFWMGHDIGVQANAYLQMPTEELRKLYMAAEEFLKIEFSSREEMDEKLKGKSIFSDVLESDVKASKAKIESLEQRVKMHEAIFKQMTEMPFEAFARWMQEKDRWAWQQQEEPIPIVTTSKEELQQLKQKVSRIEQKQEEDDKN